MNPRAPEARMRRMVAADVERVMEIAASLKDAPHWPMAAYLDALDPGAAVMRIALVAEEANSSEIAAFAVASVLAPQGELESIAVVAGGQRQGVGGRLMAAMAEELRHAGATEVKLEVRASNSTALGFYRDQGFVGAGRRLRYYADPEEDAILMALRLR